MYVFQTGGVDGGAARVRTWKLAGLTVYDVPSVEHDGQTLGSVSFSESFLDSTVSVIRPGKAPLSLCSIFIRTRRYFSRLLTARPPTVCAL